MRPVEAVTEPAYDCQRVARQPLGSSSLAGKPSVLVRRPQRSISFSPGVAAQRGLGSPGRATREAASGLCDYLTVEASLSHDSGANPEADLGFAMATVITDMRIEPLEDDSAVVDDGSSERPLHEPVPNDYGFDPWVIQDDASEEP